MPDGNIVHYRYPTGDTMHMQSANPFSTGLTAMAVLLCFVKVHGGLAAEPAWKALPVGAQVVASLSSGRVLRGMLDPRTSQDRLWLTIEDQGIRLSSIVTAENIAAVALASAEAAQGSRLELGKDVAEARRKAPSSSRQAHSLNIQAQLENWDGEAQLDGLKLYLTPRDANGVPIQVTGSLSISLSVYRGDPRDISKRYHVEESWSHELVTSDFVHHPAVVKLPFRSIQPHNERELFALGTLHVRLKIAGQGTLDATLHDVLLRPRSFSADQRSRN